MNFTWGKHEANRVAAQRIKAWVRETFGLGEESTISVLEMRCPDPDCPPHETVIALLDDPGASKRYRILKPMQEVERGDVAGLKDA